MEKSISLTDDQAELCCFMLRRDLLRVFGLLTSNKDAIGHDLSQKTLDDLRGLSNRLQETLIAFGTTSKEVDQILQG